jgi:MFS family permease
MRPSEWSRGRRVLGACIGAYFGVRFCQVLVGPVVPGVTARFSVSRGGVGLALTLMWAVYALVQLPSGALADRVGGRSAVLVALGITFLAALGMAVAPGFVVFALAVAVLGIGAGLYYNPATMLLARASDGVGETIGLHRIGGQVAGVVAPVAVAVVEPLYGWRTSLALGATLVAVTLLAFRRSVRPMGAGWDSPAESLNPKLAMSLLSSAHARTTTLMMTLHEFTGLAAMAFLPTALIESHDLGDGTANLLFAAFFAVAAVTQPIAGRLSDAWGRDPTVVALAAAGALGFGGLAVGESAIVAGGAVVLAGASMSGTPVIQSRMLDGLADGDEGTGFGLFRTTYLLVGGTSTAIVGTIADVANWDAALGLLAGIFVVLLVLAGVAGEP